MRRKTYNSQCTVCGQWYMTYVDPKNIPGAVTPTGGFICQKCRQAKQPITHRTPPPKTVQMSIDELTQKNSGSAKPLLFEILYVI